MRAFPLKRFLICMALMAPAAIAVSVAGELMDWSYGVSFAALALVGTVASMAALEENPLTWFRHPPQRRGRRYP